MGMSEVWRAALDWCNAHPWIWFAVCAAWVALRQLGRLFEAWLTSGDPEDIW